MSKAEEFGLGSGSSSEKDDKKPKEKTKTAKDIGRVTKFSVPKESESKSRDPEKKLKLFTWSTPESDDVLSESTDTKKHDSKPESPHEQSLTEAAKLGVIQETLKREQPELEQAVNFSNPESPEHADALTKLEFNSKLQEKIEHPEMMADPAVEAALTEKLAELTESKEIDEVVELSEDHLESDNEATDLPDLEADLGVTEEADEPIVGPATINPLTQTPKPASTSSTRPSPPPQRPTGGAGATPPPPNTPRPPFGATGGHNASPPHTPNAAPFVPNPNVLQTPNSQRARERSKRRGAFVLGGVLGYMVGRRGGRKRTEKRLQPEINKLNKEVDATKQKLAFSQNELTTAIHAAPPERTAPTSSKIENVSPIVTPENTAQTVKPQRPIQEILRQTVQTPENITPSKPEKPVEQVEQLITSPTSQLQQEMQPITKKIEQPPEITPKRAEQLSTHELLKVAQNILIEGNSVRRLYETNQIDHRGLVAIVKEALRGGDIKDKFRKVMLGNERQAERAREFRHDDQVFDNSSDSSKPKNLAPPAVNTATPDLPNRPDRSALQPIDTTQSMGINQVPIQSEVDTDTKKSSKNGFMIALAIGLALLLLWLIVRF